MSFLCRFWRRPVPVPAPSVIPVAAVDAPREALDVEPTAGLRLVLDIDGTLISDPRLTMLHGTAKLRPGVRELFLWAHEHGVPVGVFTSAMPSWFADVYRTLLAPAMPPGFRFEFVFTRSHCNHNPFTRTTVKRLRRVWDKFPEWDATNTLIVDDTECTFAENVQNAVLVRTYDNDPNDLTLFKLIGFLESKRRDRGVIGA